MTRSVEIPDAAVEAAHAKYYEGAHQFLQSASRTAMRAALVAARPYLMPTREQIEAEVREAVEDLRVVGIVVDAQPDPPTLGTLIGHVTGYVLAVLNGES